MSQLVLSRMYRVVDYFEKRGLQLTKENIIRNYDRARSVLRGKSDIGKDEWAFSILNTYLKIAASDFSEVCFSPKSLNDIIEKLYQENWQDVFTEHINNFISSEIVNMRPYIIGITVPMGSQIYYALFMAREIKKCLPEAKVIMGGPQITLFWNQIMNSSFLRTMFDGLLYGEGEIGLYDYIRYVDGAITANEVSGLIYLESNNEIIKNPNSIITEADVLPLADFSDYNLDEYVYAKLPYMMTKGCYWAKCSFCSYRNNYPYIRKTAIRIVYEIEQLVKKYCIRFIHFIDDAIPVGLLKEVSNELIKRKIGIKYETYLRLDPVFDVETCRQLARSGMRSVLFGLESANGRILALMNKGITIRNAINVLTNMHQAKIQTVVSCMIGFPSETEDEAMESIRFLQENQDIISQSFIVHFGLISDMVDRQEDFGIYDIQLTNPTRYDDTGFVAFGYSYKTKSGMNTMDALRIIKKGREKLNMQIFEDCFFS